LDAAKAKVVIDALQAGKSLRAAAAEAGIGHTTVLFWVDQHKDFADQYARARDIGYRLLADELIELSDRPVGGITSEGVQHARLQVDTRKWMLSKMLPKLYGERIEHEHKGGITITLTQAESRL
jgi:hypothetical protein